MFPSYIDRLGQSALILMTFGAIQSAIDSLMHHKLCLALRPSEMSQRAHKVAKIEACRKP